MELEEKLHCHGVIHMDPVDIWDEQVAALREETESCLRELDPQLQMHDFRVVPGPSKTNLIFDVVAPFGYRLTDEELRRVIQERVQECQPQCSASSRWIRPTPEPTVPPGCPRRTVRPERA